MAEEFITLRNKDRFRLFQTTLYHSVVCVLGGKCICQSRECLEAHRKGELLLAEQSVVIPPLQSSRPLPRIVLEVPQIQTAIQQCWLENQTALAEIEVIPARKES